MSGAVFEASSDPTRGAVLAAVVDALTAYTSAPPDRHDVYETDHGPPVLAALASASGHPAAHEVANSALGAWLGRLQEGSPHLGVFGGLAGIFVGAHVASSFYPRLASLAEVLRDLLASRSMAASWRINEVAWEDYDLISGPSGIVLGLTTDPACPPRFLLPATRHLAALCDRDDLERLRVGAYLDDDQRSWNYGRINTGLAHGITGVAAALCSTCRSAGSLKEFGASLERLCRWLITESYVDARGIRTWSPGGLAGKPHPAGASRRQAWCYGTPGVSWTLWEAGEILGDVMLQGFAKEAMRSFCDAFDGGLYIDDGSVSAALGICHGVAGTLAIADAFARYAGLPEAAILRDDLEAYLLGRLDEVSELARKNMTLLTGAAGILAVLLAVRGAERRWLSHLALL